ncbi:8274_t:CDS:2 [Funneliformis mosseae]|uniref:8274_t:CDS:1 n=1 Tax=Funneliformis mosseae TaxID=27381 RepID=A0A9N9GMI3_FUNMO|nr:8274_t:CDS:2 [Funneliformis mosseae]
MISLTEDCIYHVLQKLKEDREKLFNFLFVNRYFCKTVVPFLYSNPFGQELNHQNECFLINTFLKRLDAEEKSYLRKVNINLSDETERTLFEYETYLEKLSLNDLTVSIRIWLMSRINEEVSFVDQKPRSTIQMRLGDLKLCLFTGFFDKIREHSLLEFLNTISKTCRHITELGVIIDEQFDKGKFPSYIINIINNQNNLLKFTLSEPRYIGSNIVLSLESQRNSLTSIQLDFVHLCHDHISVLANCSNLKNLRLYYCGGMTLDHCNLILVKSICKVENLTMARNRWSKDITISIISTLGRSLRRLSFDQISSETLESIIAYCPNLKVLEIQFGKFDYLLLKRMKIDHLIIHPIFDLSLDFKELLQDLGRGLPTTIKHFSFITHNPLSSDNLEIFLDNINSCLVSLNFYFEMNDNLLKIILNYILEKKSLKYLGIKKFISLETSMYSLDDELIRKIRDLGVDIFFFEKNYESEDEFYNLMA